MMLTLIGTGISFDLTVSALDAINSSREIYVETYTNPIAEEKIKSLEHLSGREIIRLGRDKVESDFLVQRAKEMDICLLASGDPLTATTHITLLMDAKKNGVETQVIHNSSVYTAAPGKSGLQIYRFGKTASLVNPRPNYAPKSSLDIIRKNLESDMHSLVLLDTEPEPMGADAALDMLGEFETAIVLSRIGEMDERVSYGRLADLKGKDLGKPPFAIVVPAKLHLVEEEYLETLKQP